MRALDRKATRPVCYHRVYVWEYPVRIFHWLNALCILLLCVTGYLIGAPAELLHSTEAYQAYWFGIVRFTHLAAGNLFFFNLIIRFYWGFAGNRHARIAGYVPVKKKQWRELIDVVLAEILLIKLHAPEVMGHNALASVSYIVLFVLSIVQAALGYALYAGMSESWLPHLFIWVNTLFGSEFPVRSIHHILMWFFILFMIAHVYIVLYGDFVEGRGEVSSMVSGNKFKENRNQCVYDAGFDAEKIDGSAKAGGSKGKEGRTS